MSLTQETVNRLNDAVRRDWQAINKLAEHRVITNNAMMEHPSVVVVGDANGNILLGLIGIINGIVSDGDGQNLIEAVYDDQLNELQGFKVRGSTEVFVDQRLVSLDKLEIGKRYRVTDRAGNRWLGTYIGLGDPETGQGVHLQLSDGSVGRIYLHDVNSIIYY